MGLAQEIATTVQQHRPHPDFEVRGARCHLSIGRLGGGVTATDIDVANRLSRLFEGLNIAPEPTRVTELEIAIDTMDMAAIKPFWAAVLGYAGDGEDAVVDLDGRGPSVWFQQMHEPRPQRNRIHLDVTVAHDEAPARLRAALSAGGQLVSDRDAPSYWVLADADGNEACICTWQGRD
jgi:4a-hydroxytetrahydrobiopterin dehydratase